MDLGRLKASLGSAVVLVLAPGIVAGVIPYELTHWRGAPFFDLSIVVVVGIALVVAGTATVLETFARFALNGIGTPSPIYPTRLLVKSGLYRYVRNPMYIGVAAVILGQAILFGSMPLLEYDAIVCAAFILFVRFYEEPTLQRTFGDEYAAYRARVPAWLPRLPPKGA